MLNSKYFNLIIRMLIFFSSLVASLSILFSDEKLPGNLFLLPIIYSALILFIPSFTKLMFENIGLFALNISMVIRYLISPFLISFQGVTHIRSIIPTVESYNLATNLMIYEVVIIFFVFQLLYKKFYTIEANSKDFINEEKSKNITGWLFIALCLLLALVYPEILSRYTFVFTAEQLKSKDLGIDVASIIPLLFQLGILILTISLFNIIYKKYLKKNHYKYVVLAIITVVLTSSFIMGTSRFSIVLPLVTGLYMIFLLFNRHRKTISLISILAIFLVIILSSVLKSETINPSNSNDNFASNINDNLQLYFSGVNNVAIAVETKRIYKPFQLESITGDITRNIALVNSFFQNDKSALNDYNVTFYGGGFSRDQILPMIGQGFLYFGFILSPVFSVIILLCLMYFDSKILKTDNFFMLYIYVYIALKYGLFMMSNFTNLISFLTNNFLILFLLFKLNEVLINSFNRTVSKEVYYEHR